MLRIHSLGLALTLLVLMAGVLWAQDTTNQEDPALEPEIAAPVVEDPNVSAAEQMMEQITAPSDSPAYEEWARVAARAEHALETGRASDQALEALRAEVDEWRSRFAAARDENKVRIAALRNQIAALPEAPAEGETESDTLAAQRAQLQEQLSELETPVRAAEVAFARADTIISAIDDLLRSRQTAELFTIGPSPVNPSHWSEAASDIADTFNQAWRGTIGSIETDSQRTQFRRALIPVIILFVIAFVLIVRGRSWVINAGVRVRSRGDGPARGVWSFLISLGQMVVPLLGLLAALLALGMSGLMGLRGQLISELILAVGVNLIVARWLGSRVFGLPGAEWQVLNLGKIARAEGRLEAALLGFAYGAYQLVHELAAFEGYSEATTAVLELPVIVFAGVLMVRLGRLLLNHRESVEGEGEDEGPNFIDRTLSLAGRLLMIVGIVGPIMAALGYAILAGTVVFNTALSFAMIGFLLVLHGFFVDLWGMIRGGTTQDAREALTPVLASLVSVILSVPFFALIWGARETDLWEIWGTVMRGVTFGETVISPTDIVFLIIVFLIGVALTRLIQGMLKTTVLPKTKMDIGGRNAITSGIGYLGIFLAAVIAITSVGINLSSLAVVFGALSVGIGFGLQNIVSNFVSGIILLIERPISEGDWITVGTEMGIVKDISVRSTRIETFDRTDVVIPNSDLISGVVTNYTRGNRVGRLVIDIGVAYGSDTHRVAEILKEIVMDHPMVTVNPEPQVGFMEFGADALMFQIRAILSDVFFILNVRDELNHAIAKKFSEEGIEIPFAQRDLWIRNPESLHGPVARESGATGVRNAEPDDPRRDPDHGTEPEAWEAPDGD
ncbi:DUF3772 domain-containing protein [Maritimibacter sp. UBA3975]|uniref:DUF3772 domain-containing protein n=1 Tax=Maritimibacter sp. UBA3975 TaxID=1946833 RepID=UPI0025C6E653|nr:DUF3772 domain-containing protein [Maritimibacter sp. UBA3975]